MKGITHFLTGIAIATFFPQVVQRADAGSLLPVWGGIAGILPDTLDFKFARYFERTDLEIDPGPRPDAHQIAEQVVAAMRRAYEIGQPQRVMLHTIRLGIDLWRQYTVHLVPGRDEVIVRIGPVVGTDQIALPETESGGAREARIRADVPLAAACDAEIRVDILSGPSLRFERCGDRLEAHFLDWHRRWSHSLTLAFALGLSSAGLTALAERACGSSPPQLAVWVGLVTGLGIAAHILEDQLGYMGSNLLYPLTRKRTGGARLMHSGDAIPNVLAVWTALIMILLNLDRFSAQPRLDPGRILGLGILLPAVLLGTLYWQRQGRHRLKAQGLPLQQEDAAEIEEMETG